MNSKIVYAAFLFFVSAELFSAAVSEVVNPYEKLSEDDLVEAVENLPVPNALLNSEPSAPAADLLDQNPPPAYDVAFVPNHDANKTDVIANVPSENLELPQRQAILDRAKYRLLISVVTSGKFKEFIDLLKDPSIEFDSVDETGASPLWHACAAISQNYHKIVVNNCLEIVKTLLELKANPSRANNAGLTPLMLACNNADLIGLLIKSGADGQMPDTHGVSQLPLFLQNAMKVDNWVVIKNLLEIKADATDCKDSLIKLLQCDGTVNYPSYGNDIIKLMLANNVDINSHYEFSNWIDERRGITPLIWAVKHGYVEVVKDLLSRKADTSIVELNGEIYTKTALDYAKSSKNKEIIALLESAGAKSGCCVIL